MYEDVEEVCEDVAKAFRQKVEAAGARWSVPAKSVSGKGAKAEEGMKSLP